MHDRQAGPTVRRNACTLWGPLRWRACLADPANMQHRYFVRASQPGQHHSSKPSCESQAKASAAHRVRARLLHGDSSPRQCSNAHGERHTSVSSCQQGNRATHFVRATREATNPRQVAVMKLRRPLLCMRQKRNPPPRTEAALLAEKPADICTSQGKHGCCGRGGPGSHQQHVNGATSSSMLCTCILLSCMGLMGKRQAWPCQAAEGPQSTSCTMQGGVERGRGERAGAQGLSGQSCFAWRLGSPGLPCRLTC